jgi:hypothetical protein
MSMRRDLTMNEAGVSCPQYTSQECVAWKSSKLGITQGNVGKDITMDWFA